MQSQLRIQNIHKDDGREDRGEKFKDIRTLYNDIQLSRSTCALYKVI